MNLIITLEDACSVIKARAAGPTSRGNVSPRHRETRLPASLGFVHMISTDQPTSQPSNRHLICTPFIYGLNTPEFCIYPPSGNKDLCYSFKWLHQRCWEGESKGICFSSPEKSLLLWLFQETQIQRAKWLISAPSLDPECRHRFFDLLTVGQSDSEAWDP